MPSSQSSQHPTKAQQHWQQFLMAMMFLTRLPVGKWVQHNAALQLGMPRWFPAVGWLVGCMAALLLWLCASLLPWVPAVIIATALAIVSTGAFHEDGFADMCDAFGGGWEKEQVLRIMKDSRLGTYGTLGIGLMLASKLSLLASLPLSHALGALIAGHVLSRTVATSLLLVLPYVRDNESTDSIAKTPPAHFDKADLLFTLITSAPALLLLPLACWLPLLLGLLGLRCWAAWYYTKRIDGYTGDCLGGAQQLAELCVLTITVITVYW
jgi:adenosylcobinamide-GDP ribazoletransferase